MEIFSGAGGLAKGQKPLYRVTYRLLNAADYGVPQKRERVIIVGFRSDLNVDWDFPAPTHSQDALWWSQFVTNEYWKRHQISNTFNNDLAEQIRHQLHKKYGFLTPDKQPWLTIRDVITDLKCEETKEAREYQGHTRSFIDEPSKTIKVGAHGVPGGENMIRFANATTRYFTISETKRLQTFPDDYQINGSWTECMRQLGNAVPVKLGYVIASTIVKALENN